MKDTWKEFVCSPYMVVVVLVAIITFLLVQGDCWRRNVVTGQAEVCDTVVVGEHRTKTDLIRQHCGISVYSQTVEYDENIPSFEMRYNLRIDYANQQAAMVGQPIKITFKYYAEDGTLIDENTATSTIDAQPGLRDIIHFGFRLPDLLGKYKGWLRIVPYMKVGNYELPMSSFRIGFDMA